MPFPSSRSQCAYYSPFFFSEDGRDVFVGGYSGSSIHHFFLLLLLLLLVASSSQRATVEDADIVAPFKARTLSRVLREVSILSSVPLSISFFQLLAFTPRYVYIYISTFVTLVGGPFFRESSSQTRAALSSFTLFAGRCAC